VAGPGGGDSEPVFHSLPCISNTAVADLLQIIRARLMRFLVRRRVVEADGFHMTAASRRRQNGRPVVASATGGPLLERRR
jgi:hypothetical protein